MERAHFFQARVEPKLLNVEPGPFLAKKCPRVRALYLLNIKLTTLSLFQAFLEIKFVKPQAWGFYLLRATTCHCELRLIPPLE